MYYPAGDFVPYNPYQNPSIGVSTYTGLDFAEINRLRTRAAELEAEVERLRDQLAASRNAMRPEDV